MPISSVQIHDGPRVQVTGRHTGRLRFIFDSGAVVLRKINAADAAEWTALQTSLIPVVESEKAIADAVSSVSDDVDIEAAESGEATKEQTAVAYLRRAYSVKEPYKAFKLFDRFNAYRLSKNWPVSQVAARLADAGLTASEWDDMLAAYQYLNTPERIAAMEAVAVIQEAWDNR